MIRFTPARFTPSWVSAWIMRSRSMSRAEYRRVLPGVRCGRSSPLRS